MVVYVVCVASHAGRHRQRQDEKWISIIKLYKQHQAILQRSFTCHNNIQGKNGANGFMSLWAGRCEWASAMDCISFIFMWSPFIAGPVVAVAVYAAFDSVAFGSLIHILHDIHIFFPPWTKRIFRFSLVFIRCARQYRYGCNIASLHTYAIYFFFPRAICEFSRHLLQLLSHTRTLRKEWGKSEIADWVLSKKGAKRVWKFNIENKPIFCDVIEMHNLARWKSYRRQSTHKLNIENDNNERSIATSQHRHRRHHHRICKDCNFHQWISIYQCNKRWMQFLSVVLIALLVLMLVLVLLLAVAGGLYTFMYRFYFRLSNLKHSAETAHKSNLLPTKKFIWLCLWPVCLGSTFF